MRTIVVTWLCAVALGASLHGQVRGQAGVAQGGVETLDFETENDGAVPLVNGRELSRQRGFGARAAVDATSASGFAACVFDSTPGGPNAGSSDPDLLVGRGNLLVLQERGLQTIPGRYDFPDDDRRGGAFRFSFGGDLVAPRSIALVDVCPQPDQDVAVVLTDVDERTRTFLVPSGWTEDVTTGGSGVRTLQLATLEEQPGFAATATASQHPRFDEAAVLTMDVRFSGSGGLDDVTFVRGPRAPFRITSCSLGCQALPPYSYTCSDTSQFVNRDLVVDFNMAVELSSVNTLAFQVLDVTTALQVPGSFSLHPDDDSVLRFRPQLSFDASGNPLFAFEDGGTYVIFVLGTAVDPTGPYVTSTSGELNERQLACAFTTRGVLDHVPGPPTVAVTLDVVESYDPAGVPATITSGVPAAGASDVFVGTDVTFTFDDVMVPRGLVDPLTGTSSTLVVGLLPVTGPPVPAPVAGVFALAIDLDAYTTTVVFRPAAPLVEGRCYTVDVGPGAEDLAGNALVPPGPIVFTTERRPAARPRARR